MIIDATTKSGAIYRLDLDDHFWQKRRDTEDGPRYEVHLERTSQLKVGTALTWPWNDKESWEDADAPEVGKHLYVASRDVWYASTPVVSIVEVPSWDFGVPTSWDFEIDEETV